MSTCYSVENLQTHAEQRLHFPMPAKDNQCLRSKPPTVPTISINIQKIKVNFMIKISCFSTPSFSKWLQLAAVFVGGNFEWHLARALAVGPRAVHDFGAAPFGREQCEAASEGKWDFQVVFRLKEMSLRCSLYVTCCKFSYFYSCIG